MEPHAKSRFVKDHTVPLFFVHPPLGTSQKLFFCILHLTDLIRQADSLAPPTQPTSPEKKRLKPRLITEYVQNISPSTNLVAIPIRKLPKKPGFCSFSHHYISLSYSYSPGDSDGGSKHPGHVADHYATKQLGREGHIKMESI